MYSKYILDEGISRAWDNVHASVIILLNNPHSYTIACYHFFNALHAYHFKIDKELGGDEYGQCLLEVSAARSLIVTPEQAKAIKTLQDSILFYPTYAFHQVKRHSEILNAGLRKQISNELQTWFMSLGRHLSLLGDIIEIKEGGNINSLPEHIDFRYSKILIDYSEDYFIDCTLEFINALCDFIIENHVSILSVHAIYGLLNHSVRLLYQRDQPAIKRFQELAMFAASQDLHDDMLHDIISQFMAKLPPEPFNYLKLPAAKRMERLELFFNEKKVIYQSEHPMLTSFLVTFCRHQLFPDQLSVERKLMSLPHLHMAVEKLNCDHEDYFFDVTFSFIEQLCSYVLRHPEATIIHDRHHIINKILATTKKQLFDRVCPSSERLGILIELAISYDNRPKGELKKILLSFIQKAPGFTNYGKIKISDISQFLASRLNGTEFYVYSKYVPSQLTNRDLQIRLDGIPSVVLKYLEEHYMQETSSVWKFINWFKFLFGGSSFLNKVQSLPGAAKILEDSDYMKSMSYAKT